MQQQSIVATTGETPQESCAFCEPGPAAHFILKQTPSFRIVTDHAPLVEGHLLIMPRQHYACYGAVPAALDAELHALKQEVADFFQQTYAPAIFWEHGVFRQTVYHAHLHCFPFGNIHYEREQGLHTAILDSQDELRTWYQTHGHYFYLQDHASTLLFPPHMDQYMRVVKEILYPSVSARGDFAGWRSPQQRIEAGKPLIEALIDKWHQFKL